MGVDYNRLRLKYHGNTEKLDEILQMECRDKCAKKLVDTLSSCKEFLFPSLALAEMSTSDAVAAIHASMVGHGCRLLDMTAGLGIDSFHFASAGCDVTAIELSHDAAKTLRHNVQALGLTDCVHVIEDNSIDWLERVDAHFDVIFIDPARRDTSGRHIALKLCSPDITANIRLLLSRAQCVMVKLSPMMDISSAKAELGITHCEITVIGTTRECKEIVMTIDSDSAYDNDDDIISCVTVGKETYHVQHNSLCDTEMPAAGNFLLQPYPAVMKGTGGNVTGYKKLHPNTHLYVAESIQPKFPGVHHHITEIIPFNKHAIKVFSNKYPKINVITRNFPLSAPELVKKLGVKEGGDNILFGATLQDGSKALIVTECDN